MPAMPILVALICLLATIACPAAVVTTVDLGDYTATNPRIDFAAFLAQASETRQVRDVSRLSEERFIAWSQLPGTVILDARSHDKYALLHVAGAINLPFADISEPALAKMLPDRKRLILIYCNNNFTKAPVAFESKSAGASLNISTFIALHSYGYERVFELGPLLDVHTTRIALVGERK
jgi:rhodanese-related sulfurtransferase